MHLYPDNSNVLLQKDEKGMTALHYLWIMIPRKHNAQYKSYSTTKSFETAVARDTVGCLRLLKTKFPDIMHNFVKAWSEVSGRKLHAELQSFSSSMRSIVMCGIAEDEGRLPLHVACNYGMHWQSGLRTLCKDHLAEIEVCDEATGLRSFALAAMPDGGDLDTVYQLLRRQPV
eukprot:CAMPEP_0197256728 /NCGR_PEP_ID=MMETSP1429-20130617/76352_1 /TAXON_ID=49237 /ORGANISM="Chaetoceros  sp., Strain UNC1202" /LENGTH=172 /DNA_ID=CAMNT_0042720379 /DNA_START=354 /DNA_END=872 /DNA_ORIENTATION=-